MPTPKDVEKALQVIADYERDINQQKIKYFSANEVGCRVKWSKYALENEAKPRDVKGTVIQWLKWGSESDGLVWVKWDGIAKPETMHIHWVDMLK